MTLDKTGKGCLATGISCCQSRVSSTIVIYSEI